MDIFQQITSKIIKEQESIIGPLAIEQAKKVKGLTVDWSNRKVSFQGDKKAIIDDLVEQYRKLFGQASVEVCREAAKEFISKIPQNEMPSLLK